MLVNTNYAYGNDITLYLGDCIEISKDIPDESIDLIVTSPPYCMKKAYENTKDDIQTFKSHQEMLIPEMYRILKNGGHICWQVGYHVNQSSVIPLDYFVYQIFTEYSNTKEVPLVLRNRIIWTFGHGLNSSKRFSGRHETILWFTKGNNYAFDLDSIRVPQKYPGKKSYRGKNLGQLSGNPAGKNPSDVWDIPNVKANHIEKTCHPCQFPVAIPARLIRALTQEAGTVFDPYMGSGSTGVAAVLEKRKFIGSEIVQEYYSIARERIEASIAGTIRVREDTPVMSPDPNTEVAKLPEAFRMARGDCVHEENRQA